MSTTYRATRTEPNLLSSNKFQDLSLLSIGIVIHLRWYGGEKTLEQLGKVDPAISHAEIKLALNELIEFGLVEETIDAEVVDTAHTQPAGEVAS